MSEPQGTLKDQLAAELRQRIEGGDLPPGEKFPTETELMDLYGAGRGTVRDAIKQLELEGRIGPAGEGRRKMVIGRQLLTIDLTVIDQHEHRRRYPGVDGFVAAVKAQDAVPDQEITIGLVKATQEVASALRLTPGTMVVERRRLRFRNDRVLDLDISFYDEDLAAQAPRLKSPDDIKEGAVMYLAGLGIVQKWYDDTEESRMPTPVEAQQLNIRPSVPLLVHTRTGLLEDLTPVRYTVTFSPGDRVRHRFRIPA